MPASEAFTLDGKIDDGKPGSGLFISYVNGSSYNKENCAKTIDATTAVYEVSNASAFCSLMFRLAF